MELIKYVYISDLFYGQVNGGAEANDDVLIKVTEKVRSFMGLAPESV